MSASQPALFNVQEFTDDGITLVGGRLYTYAYGTTAQKVAYTDPEGTVPQTYTADGLGGQFIALNARGELPTSMYLGTGAYDISLKRADGSTVWTRRADGVSASADALKIEYSSGIGSGLIGYSPLATYVQSTLGLHNQQFVCLVDWLNTAEIADATAAAANATPPTIDTTAKIQEALNFCALKDRTLWWGNLRCWISGNGLNGAGPGILADRVGYGSGIYSTVTGVDKWTLTVTGRPTNFDITVAGTGQIGNGVFFSGCVQGRIGSVRVTNFAGGGIRIYDMWDTDCGPLSVEECGSAVTYAFEVDGVVAETNMTTFRRIQVETSKIKSMRISPLTLSCVFLCIHSEKALGDPGVPTWVLGGSGCYYAVCRLDASGGVSGNASVKFSGGQTHFDCARVEGNISTSFEGINGNTLGFSSPQFDGVSFVSPLQIGTINIEGGRIARLNSATGSLRVYGTKIQSMTLDFAGGNPSLAIFDGCEIGELKSSSTNSSATFNSCTINSGTVLQGNTIFNNSSVTLDSPAAISNTMVTLNNSSIICANVNVNSAGLFLRNGSYIKGNLTCAGNFNSMADDSSFVTGTVSGWGAPIFATYLPGGVFSRGMRAKNLVPAVGSPKGWVYTGTYPWTSEGNL